MNNLLTTETTEIAQYTKKKFYLNFVILVPPLCTLW